MGVVHKEPLKTSDLSDWIYRVKVKKQSCKRQRRKNLFVEAVLASALSRAETELRLKQQERRLRWQQIKATCLTKDSYNSTSPIVWDTRTCEDLNSLDSFMSQLKEVKVALER